MLDSTDSGTKKLQFTVTGQSCGETLAQYVQGSSYPGHTRTQDRNPSSTLLPPVSFVDCLTSLCLSFLKSSMGMKRTFSEMVSLEVEMTLCGALAQSLAHSAGRINQQHCHRYLCPLHCHHSGKRQLSAQSWSCGAPVGRVGVAGSCGQSWSGGLLWAASTALTWALKLSRGREEADRT